MGKLKLFLQSKLLMTLIIVGMISANSACRIFCHQPDYPKGLDKWNKLNNNKEIIMKGDKRYEQI